MAPESLPAYTNRLWVGWIVFLSICGTFFFVRISVEKRRQSDLIEWKKERALDSGVQLGRLTFLTPITLEHLADGLAPGKPLPPRQYFSSRAFHTAIAGAQIGPEYSGWSISMDFSQRHGDSEPTLTTWSIAPPPELNRGPSPLWWAIEQTRMAGIWLAMIVWLLGMVIIASIRRARRPVAPICVAAALVGVLCAALAVDFGWPNIRHPLQPSPPYIIAGLTFQYPWAASLSTHPGIYDGGIIAAAIALLLWTIPSRPLETSRCTTCRYDLTGNESGVCPECGTETARHKRETRLAAFVPVADRLRFVEI